MLEGGDRADSTHWPSCKSLFYGPCNDPPASNLHSVALQIEPAASGSRRGMVEWGLGGGGLRMVARGSGRLENTHRVTMHSPTHTHKQPHAAMFAFIKMHAFSHPIYLNPDFLCKGRRKRRRVVFLHRSKLARSNCAQWYVVRDGRFPMHTLIALIALAFYIIYSESDC